MQSGKREKQAEINQLRFMLVVIFCTFVTQMEFCYMS